MNHLEFEYGSIDINVSCVVNAEMPCPADFESFHNFPKRMGWTVDDKFELRPRSGAAEGVLEPLEPFLQAWLFFGLIFTIVRTDRQLLGRNGLVVRGTIDTQCLRKALSDWAEWEKANRDGIQLRMIRAEFVLEKARQVVRKNCAYVDGHTVYSDRRGDHLYLTDEFAMSLMVLGETLAAVKARIMAEVDGAHIRGWHGDDDSGWGPPRYVFVGMKNDNWCPRTIRLLKGQLGSSATLLLAAYKHSQVDRDEIHKTCDKDVCRVMSKKNGKYASRHATPDCNDARCAGTMIGPCESGMESIIQMLDRDDIPLLRFVNRPNGDGFDLEAFPYTPGTEFAAISHVWAHGYGNETENKLHWCQMDYIREHLVHVMNKMRGTERGETALPFWMDTLVIPVSRSNRDQRERAIRQIFRVFRESSCTIVLDAGLCAVDAGHDGKPAQAAMKVLSSGWMRRLWTLQEAFGSKKIYIPFKANHVGFWHIKEFDELTGSLARTQEPLTAALITTLRNHLLYNIMGHERQIREMYLWHSQQPPPKRGALLVANAWRAARWRNTGKPAHETLAIATLLNLDYGETLIGGASNNEGLPLRTELDQMMRDFWFAFDEQFKGAIPPGIIFLPGEKVRIQGVGWAPQTWMKAHEVDYPDPLQSVASKTELDKENGLRVRYPGFMLHCQNRKKVLGTDEQHNSFCFPVDRNLLEWYRADSAELADGRPNEFIKGINDMNTPLAIILSRPRPQDLQPEIALLVEVWKRRNETQDDETKTVMYCQTIRRLYVSRERRFYDPNGAVEDNGAAGSRSAAVASSPLPHMAPSRTANSDLPLIMTGREGGTGDMDLIIGEVVGTDQEWYVDSYFPERHGHRRGGPQKSGLRRVFGGRPKNPTMSRTNSMEIGSLSRISTGILSIRGR